MDQIERKALTNVLKQLAYREFDKPTKKEFGIIAKRLGLRKLGRGNGSFIILGWKKALYNAITKLSQGDNYDEICLSLGLEKDWYEKEKEAW